MISSSSRSGILAAGLCLFGLTSALAQVSPTEVKHPRAKADEQKYFPQLVSLQKTIGETQFPFTFRLARYLDAKPGQRAALDSNGIEFVSFQDKVVLKVSGFYRVAFNSMQVTQNGRAGQTLQSAVLPILRLVTEQIPQNYDYDAIGFEILYDARDSSGSYDYEGHEVLTAVFNRDDAFALAQATTDAERQEILNRSDIFVNGKEFALGLGQNDPVKTGSQARSDPQPTLQRASLRPPATPHATAMSGDVAPQQTVRGADVTAPEMDAATMQRKLQAEVSSIRNSDAVPNRMQNPPRLPWKPAAIKASFTSPCRTPFRSKGRRRSIRGPRRASTCFSRPH